MQEPLILQPVSNTVTRSHASGLRRSLRLARGSKTPDLARSQCACATGSRPIPLTRRVLNVLSDVSQDLPSPAVARGLSELTQRLEALDEAERADHESRLRAAARHQAELERQRIEEELALDRARTTTEAAAWFKTQAHIAGAGHLGPGDAASMIAFLDRLDIVRRTMKRGALNGPRRHQAAQTWLRVRLLPDETKRVSVCWQCHSTVYSDLNPQCPECRWMVCLCDACRDPRRDKGPCARMAQDGFAITEWRDSW